MAVVASPLVAGHRPGAVWTTIGVLAFLGVSAVGGGTALVVGTGAPPRDWLDRIPVVDSWLVPGLVLGVGFGLGSLVTGYGMLRRHRWSWFATLALGLGQLAWIGLELGYLPQLSWLQAVYGAVGLALVLLPLHPAVRGYLAT